ncbi:MAG TPA: hypothetical protein DCQ98_05520 [Planctomycetaceae bacterium]|nr:hypothetical protein [Planctomycetaceae bacterium]
MRRLAQVEVDGCSKRGTSHGLSASRSFVVEAFAMRERSPRLRRLRSSGGSRLESDRRCGGRRSPIPNDQYSSTL